LKKATAMKMIEIKDKMSEEEYFLFEEKSVLKHELIEGNLYEMSGASIFHNSIVGNLYVLFRSLLQTSEWKVAFEGYKIKTPGNNFFYPDVTIFPVGSEERYYTEKPVLITEVLSDSTRKYDLTDKFIQYCKVETLQYYLCIEPEQQVIIFNAKQENGEWIAETFTKDEQVIELPKLKITLTVSDIYKG
jgi:Uma2 family endonuclease